jgi:hypothetical protein
VLVPPLQAPELDHVALPEAPHERRQPGAKLPAECGRGQPRLHAVVRFAICDFGVRETTESQENSKQLVGFGEAVLGQHLPSGLAIVEYST